MEPELTQPNKDAPDSPFNLTQPNGKQTYSDPTGGVNVSRLNFAVDAANKLAARTVGQRITAKIASHRSPTSSLASTRNETTKAATPNENMARDTTIAVHVL